MLTEIEKGSNFAKIVGNFGEYLVCHWLSLYGFDVVIVDHTGMDIIAYHPRRKQRLGITVKSRTRVGNTETVSTHVFNEAKRDRKKLVDACDAFRCDPWIAVYVERGKSADLYLTSLDHFDKMNAPKGKRAVDAWKMTSTWKDKYFADNEVRHIEFDFRLRNWWPVTAAP